VKPVRLWLLLDLRRRWRSLVVLALLIAIAAAVVLTAVAGARRGQSALLRLEARTLPTTVVALPNQPGFDWDKIRAIPEVTALATFAVSSFGIEGIPLADNPSGFPPGNDEWLRTIERPIVLAGRLADPDRIDEATVTSAFVQGHHKDVGDFVTVRLAAPKQLESIDSLEAAQLKGPRLRVRIVGVIRSVWNSGLPGYKGALLVTPAVLHRYPDNIVGKEGYINALIRLRDGEADIPAFRERLAEVTGRHDIDVWNMPEKYRRQQQTLVFEARSLLAFGLAAFVAALFLVGQAVARYAAASVADLHVLRALGMTRRQTLLAAVAGPFLTGVSGALAGVAIAVFASQWFPIGTASEVEPAPGLDADALVLGVGLLAIPLLVLGGAVGAAWFGLSGWPATSSAGGRRSVVATTVARSGAPVPVIVGARFALETGRGRTALPVRPALLGAVVGVLGILAAFTFSNGVNDAARNPRRYGQTYQLTSFFGYNGNDFAPSDKILKAVAAVPGVAGVNDARSGVVDERAGQASVTLYSYAPVGSPVDAVLTSGRLPVSATEVALTPASAKALKAHVGESVFLAGPAGARTLTVTGLGFVPAGPHNGYNDGGWVTASGFDSLFTTTSAKKFKFHFGLIMLDPGADPQASAKRIHAAVAAAVPAAKQMVFAPPAPPEELVLLRQVRVLPLALGVFLVLLAMGAVGHALATAVRRRRHDVAVLRALGMTRWQSRGLVVTQATVLAGVGLIFGVPLGLALGRIMWRVVADYTPLQYAPPLAVWALLLVGPLALVLANLLAAWPGQQAARLRIGHVLRAE